MKVNKLFNVSITKVNEVIPKRYHSFLNTLPKEDNFDIIIFPNEKIIDSKHFLKLSKKNTFNNFLLIVGYNFTVELINSAPERVIFIRENTSEWTDESHNNIKQFRVME